MHCAAFLNEALFSGPGGGWEIVLFYNDLIKAFMALLLIYPQILCFSSSPCFVFCCFRTIQALQTASYLSQQADLRGIVEEIEVFIL